MNENLSIREGRISRPYYQLFVVLELGQVDEGRCEGRVVWMSFVLMAGRIQALLKLYLWDEQFNSPERITCNVCR